MPPVPTYSVAWELLSVLYASPTNTPLMAVQAVAMEDTSIGDGPSPTLSPESPETERIRGLCVEFPVQDRGGAKLCGRSLPGS